MKLVLMMVLFLATSVAHAEWYASVGVGESSINMFSAEEIEGDLFETEYSSAAFREDRKSTTSEFALGYALSDHFLVEVGCFNGFEHSVETEVVAGYYGVSADFTVKRKLRARGCMLSGILEFPVTDQKSLFGRLGVARVMVTGDVFADDFPYSLHAEKDYTVPVIGIGGRHRINNQWSVALEYRVFGHPDVTQTGVSVRYTF